MHQPGQVKCLQIIIFIFLVPAVNFLYDSRIASTPGQLYGLAPVLFFLVTVRSSGSLLTSVKGELSTRLKVM